MPFRNGLHAAAVLTLLTAPAAVDAGETRAPSHPFDPSAVEVVVVGCPHLLQTSAADRPAVDLVRRRLERFEPDHVAVEWLHPSIDPATTEAYRPFEDLTALARLWGYEGAALDSVAARTREVLETQTAHDLPAAATRIELGKLHYLARDRLNAGYQWWVAGQLGADVSDLRRLTRDNFEGHELEVWGFPIARANGVEHLTPCDYQGDDAAWIWMEIVQRVADHAVTQVHGLTPGEDGWDETMERYGRSLEAYANEQDTTWIHRYGRVREVAEFAEVVDAWVARRRSPPPPDEPPGLGRLRHLQTDEYAAEKRRMYEEIYPMISLDGLGQRLVDNWLVRNRKMIDFIEADIRRLGRRRVMVLVGEGHKPFFDEELRARGYRVVSALDYLSGP